MLDLLKSPTFYGKFDAPGRQGVPSPVAIGKERVFFGTWKNENYRKDRLEGHSGVLFAFSKKGDKLWSHDSAKGSILASGIESAPLILDDGYVYRLDDKGNKLWEAPAIDPYDPEAPYDDNEQFIPSPVLSPDAKTVYVCSHWVNVYDTDSVARINRETDLDIEPVEADKYGKLYAIDTETGKRLWSYDPSKDEPLFGKKNILRSPAVGDDGTIYFACDDKMTGYLYAIRPDGKLKWRFPDKVEDGAIGKLTSSVSIGKDGTIYAGSFNFSGKAALHAFTPDGKLKWTYEIKENRITAAPSISDEDIIYIGGLNWGFVMRPGMSKKGHIYAIKDNGKSASLEWKYEVEGGLNSAPAIDHHGNIFFGTYSDQTIIDDIDNYHLYALDKQGNKLWSYPMEGRMQASPTIAEDGNLYIDTVYPDSKLYAFGRLNAKKQDLSIL